MKELEVPTWANDENKRYREERYIKIECIRIMLFISMILMIVGMAERLL